jgi:hypothetical protein
VWFHLFLTSTLDGGEWLTSNHGRCILGNNPGTPGVGGCVDPRAGLDVSSDVDAMSLNIYHASFQYKRQFVN